MRRFWNDMNPSVRGFLILALIALTVVVLNLYNVLNSLNALARIAFLLAIAFFVFLLWRERRDDIGTWPSRAKFAFYGGAGLIVADIAAYVLLRASGYFAVAFLLVLGLCGYAMFRTWREQHTYGF